MKKILFLCLACLFAVAISTSQAAFEERTESFYSNMTDEGVAFYKKLKSCTPAKYKESKESVYGKTKTGQCHYSFKEYYKGDLVDYDCFMPMSVAIGYATTALDVYEYTKDPSALAYQRLVQNNEIRKVMRDYCKMRIK
ncbi:hypothetical protein IJ531_06025 [bacterium]|nr:hypothetical protein [bacterium]